jgi:hypothetical protein
MSIDLDGYTDLTISLDGYADLTISLDGYADDFVGNLINNLLLETGAADNVLLETGDQLLLES